MSDDNVSNDDEGLKELPCGCVMGKVGDAFIIKPCSPNCKYFLYAIDVTKKQGKPLLAMIDKRDESRAS